MTATVQGRERAAAAGSDDSTSAVGLNQPSQEVQMHVSMVGAILAALQQLATL